MQEVIISLIGVLGTLSSILFAYLAFRKSEDKLIKEEGALISDIRYIKTSISRMELKLDKVENNYNDLLKRLIKVEEKQKNIEKIIERRDQK